MRAQRIKLKIGRILKVTSLTTKDPPIDPMERHVLPWKRQWVSSFFPENGRGQSLETEANCFITLDSQQLFAWCFTWWQLSFLEAEAQEMFGLGFWWSLPRLQGSCTTARQPCLLRGPGLVALDNRDEVYKAFDFLFGSEILAIKDVFISRCWIILVLSWLCFVSCISQMSDCIAPLNSGEISNVLTLS